MGEMNFNKSIISFLFFLVTVLLVGYNKSWSTFFRRNGLPATDFLMLMALNSESSLKAHLNCMRWGFDLSNLIQCILIQFTGIPVIVSFLLMMDFSKVLVEKISLCVIWTTWNDIFFLQVLIISYQLSDEKMLFFSLEIR